MTLVLGIDAAWTEQRPSGVALLRRAEGKWRLVANAPSYESFIGLAEGKPVDWRKVAGTALDIPYLLEAAESLGREKVNCIAIDMPIARNNISGRRGADQKIAIAFGATGAGTHSPNAERPGSYGARITRGFCDAGFSLATARDQIGERSLIEVFPLAALVRLMQVSKRPRYKVAKTRKYWPEIPHREDRIRRLSEEWSTIIECLRKHVVELRFEIPPTNRFSVLKPYEDALDAIICGCVGAFALEGNAEPFGDDDSAIWVPHARNADSICEYLAAIPATLSEWDSCSDTETYRDI